MRITLEPTAVADPSDTSFQHKVVIETTSDDEGIEELGDLLRAALLAWGFHHENVDDLIPPR